MNIVPAWKITKGSSKTIVAVLDTGVAQDIADLPGVIDGESFYGPDSTDVDGHGTACAGIIAAKHNDALIAGVCPECTIMAVKVLSDFGTGTWSSVSGGMEAAVDDGAHVLSMSLGGDIGNELLEVASKYVYNNNVPNLVAAGNSGYSFLAYPAAYEQNIAIGAMSPCCERKSGDSCDNLGWASQYGTGLDVMAGGVFLRTITTSGTLYQNFGGTSGATPHVAGLVGLIRSKNMELTVDEIRSLLHQGAQPLETGKLPAFETGYGRIDAYATLSLLCVAGDANDDKLVNVQDIVIMVNYILGYNTDTEVCKLDYDNDGMVTVLDIVKIVNYILHGGER